MIEELKIDIICFGNEDVIVTSIPVDFNDKYTGDFI